MSSSAKSMKCTHKCMELSSFVVGFDIVELWTCDPSGNYQCNYVYATERALGELKNLVVGAGRHLDQCVTHGLSSRVSVVWC